MTYQAFAVGLLSSEDILQFPSRAKLQNTGPLLRLNKLSWLGGSSVVSKDLLFSWLGGSAVKGDWRATEPSSHLNIYLTRSFMLENEWRATEPSSHLNMYLSRSFILLNIDSIYILFVFYPWKRLTSHRAVEPLKDIPYSYLTSSRRATELSRFKNGPAFCNCSPSSFIDFTRSRCRNLRKWFDQKQE